MAKGTGRLLPPIIDYFTGKTSLVIEIENAREIYEEYKDCEKIIVEIKKHRKKRSLDANAYYWTLLTKLAKALNTSNPELHNQMLNKYGYPWIVEEQLMRVVLPDTDEARKKIDASEEYHLKPTTDVRVGTDGITYRTYIMMRGSSSYNTEEMARLIEGLISECKDAGIPESEIMTPDEKRILKERYGIDV